MGSLCFWGVKVSTIWAKLNFMDGETIFLKDFRLQKSCY